MREGILEIEEEAYSYSYSDIPREGVEVHSVL